MFTILFPGFLIGFLLTYVMIYLVSILCDKNISTFLLGFFSICISVFTLTYKITRSLLRMKGTVTLPRFRTIGNEGLNILDFGADIDIIHPFMRLIRNGNDRNFNINIRNDRNVRNVRNDRNDRQNIHGVVVQKSIVKSINDLKKQVKLKISRKNVLNEVRNAIICDNDSDETKKTRALNCLDKMQITNSYIQNLDMKELDILDLIRLKGLY